MNIPNLLSVSRILLAIIILLFLSNPKIALVIFLIAALTDVLDGYLARKWNQETKLGQILDPIADKILVIMVLIALLRIYDLPYWYLLITLRDVNNIIAIPIIQHIKSKKILIIPPTILGKLTTLFQKISIVLILLDFYHHPSIIITIIISFLASIDYNSRI